MRMITKQLVLALALSLLTSTLCVASETIEDLSTNVQLKKVGSEHSSPAPAKASSQGPKDMTHVEVPHDHQEKPLTQGAAPAADTHENSPAQNHSHEASSHPVVAGVPGEKSLGWLKNGNTRFRKGLLRADGQNSAAREKLVSGQKPHAIVLSCSDSRVPPEIVFDQKLGEIFVVRAAGQVLDAATLASIEYAVAHLGSKLIVVMGHESCGAVKAAHAAFKGGSAGSPHLDKLVADIQPRIQKFSQSPVSSDTVPESWANVEGVAKDLIQRSQIVRDAVSSGDVKITRAMYHLGSGRVDWKE